MSEHNVTMTTEEVKPVEKIKAINPVITVNTAKTDKPCYSIQYYDLADNTWHIGYSSYNLDYVREWLAEYFEPIEADVRPVNYGHWKDDGCCAVCGHENDGYYSDFCPQCGARMLE
ncbi:MAG: hypothetical protein NC247_04935 [Ruminococcus flavefaciens]|nr:hypothetical protein [Ruminococcus flavefaciens]MCM1361041.1 hypothetical protein [Clostridiales bacterium]